MKTFLVSYNVTKKKRTKHFDCLVEAKTPQQARKAVNARSSDKARYKALKATRVA